MSSIPLAPTAHPAERFLYPAEWSPHLATILGFPSEYSIASTYYEDACQEIINLATAISAFEPVRLYARPEDVPKAQSMIDEQSETQSRALDVSVIAMPTNHLWVRDTGPVYVRSTSNSTPWQRYAINFRFSEWGKWDKINEHDRATDGLDWPVMGPELLNENATLARRIIAQDTSPSPVVQVESLLRLEGGALVIDGEGTLLATESSILNENRNPDISRADVEAELRRLLGVEKIIWFPGRRDLDVTDIHCDAEVNFVRPGVVVLSRPHPSAPPVWMDVHTEILQTLQSEVDARGRPFEIHILDEPDPSCLTKSDSYDEPATNYVNLYFCNGGLILPQFGDKVRDEFALRTLQTLCPDRTVCPLQVRALPLAGGVIHCSTQPVIDVGND